ncbi:hypothetical protein ACLKA7_006358 [Drosophila subpalustris]
MSLRALQRLLVRPPAHCRPFYVPHAVAATTATAAVDFNGCSVARRESQQCCSHTASISASVSAFISASVSARVSASTACCCPSPPQPQPLQHAFVMALRPAAPSSCLLLPLCDVIWFILHPCLKIEPLTTQTSLPTHRLIRHNWQRSDRSSRGRVVKASDSKSDSLWERSVCGHGLIEMIYGPRHRASCCGAGCATKFGSATAAAAAAAATRGAEINARYLRPRGIESTQREKE